MRSITSTEMLEISVIMPIYNAEEFLVETLESFLQNTFEGVELIAVDDGSTDSSLQILKDKVPDCKILEQENGGPARARNLALQHAQGRYIAFLDADDLWPEGSLTGLWDVLKTDDSARIAQGKVETFHTGEVAEALRSRFSEKAQYRVNIGSALFYYSDLRALGGFDESLRFDEDTDLWIRCWEEGLVKKHLPGVTLRYRLHQTNMTVDAKPNSLALLPILKKHRDRMRGRSTLSSQNIAEYLGWKQPGQEEKE